MLFFFFFWSKQVHCFLTNHNSFLAIQGIKTVERAVVNKGKEKYKDKEGKSMEREKYSLIVEG